MILMKYMPDYYRKSEVFINLLTAFTKALNDNNHSIEDLGNQLFVDKATWGLDIWEKELNIYTDLSKPYTDRREFIKSRLRGSGTCTIEMIKNTALAYTNAEIDVIENNPDYSFVIKFVGVKGIPNDVNSFKRTIDTIKPAHLVYTVEYSYNTHNFLKAYTHAALGAQTHEQIRIFT
ncbi:MAG: YmfQ family protein [Eubacteriales bacterium]|nr:YmfQ family protein [Eubacteriales bacterium]